MVEKHNVWSVSVHRMVTVFTVEKKVEMDSLTRTLRSQGYNIVTFTDKLRELERPEHFVVIERKGK